MTAYLLPVFGFSAALVPLAQIQTPPMHGVGEWFWNALGALAIVVLLLTLVVQWKKAFGRTPPLSEVLTGLATLKHVDESNQRVSELQQELHTRSRGLEEQISGLRHDIKDERQSAKSEMEVTREEIQKTMQAMNLQIDEKLSRMDARRSGGIGNLHEQLKNAEIKLAAVDADGKTAMRKIDVLDGKIDRILERIPKRTS